MPALILSPYAKQGYIDHTQYQFESTLKFIEWRFSLPPLTDRDLHANNLLNAFDFSQKPLNPPHLVRLTGAEFAAIRPHINLARTIVSTIYPSFFLRTTHYLDSRFALTMKVLLNNDDLRGSDLKRLLWLFLYVVIESAIEEAYLLA